MKWTATGVTKKRTQWAVQVKSDSGEAKQLTYRSEAQARFFAAVLELGPSRLPSVSDRLKEKLAKLPPAPSRARRAAPRLEQPAQSEDELVFSSVEEAL